MTSKASLYRNEKNEDEEDNKSGTGVFTEAQRKAVRQKLIGFVNKNKNDTMTKTVRQEKKKSPVPLLVDQEWHTSFNFISYRSELDEIPHLLLFRTKFQPYIENKTPLTMEQLRFYSEMCGMEGTMIQDKSNGYMFTGEMPRGGPIKQISFLLSNCFEGKQRRVIIRDIVFKTSI